ncbi:MAG TPA: F0F1 ATP synthase subunit I [Candidatus Pseudomonas excrementavium]|uniref:F0F1 ATP synthase subunit I n=1 Tax=Halopseudomonas bauzanensis TaxID=653930 RepID=UPI001C3BE7E3|nr:F0F1 ATP synthase subunit I [Halopseudomonas bauzanensis]HIZ52091.1 F0F1 ATP synthase subunit I [Candidatus Pseudomonas excrementavium]
MDARTPNKSPFHRTPAFPVLTLQLIVTLAVALVLWGFQGWIAGYSGLLGGLVALIPNSYFAFRVYRYSGARSARAIVGEFYSGEAGKLILTAVLFIAVWLGVKPLAVAAVFGGYLAVLAVGASALLIVKGFPKH